MRYFEERVIVKYIVMESNFYLVLACHITGVYDVNRNMTLANDAYELVQEWSESVAKSNLKGIIFHNNFSDETCVRYANEYISFERIEYNPEYNPNVYRYFIYRDFLAKSRDSIKGVFVTDVSDVTLVNNPFIDTLFIDNPTSIFIWVQLSGMFKFEKISIYVFY